MPHKYKAISSVFSILLLLSWLLASCGEPASNTDGNLTLQFALKVNGQNLTCGKEYTGLGSGKIAATFTDARFYVSNIRLITSMGETVPVQLNQDGQWQYQNVALLDFEDGTASCKDGGNTATRSIVSGKVPAGNYNGVIFDLGLPFELNHADAASAPAPLNIPALWWNWQVGYKFVRLDMRLGGEAMGAGMAMPTPIAGATPSAEASGHGGMAMAANAYLIHLGSTGCPAPNEAAKPTEPCSNPNLTTVRLTNPNFVPGKTTIVADVNTLLSGVALEKSMPKPPGCMSGTDDPDCSSLFPGFGLNLQTGKMESQAAAQKFFQLELANK